MQVLSGTAGFQAKCLNHRTVTPQYSVCPPLAIEKIKNKENQQKFKVANVGRALLIVSPEQWEPSRDKFPSRAAPSSQPQPFTPTPDTMLAEG